MSRIICIVCCTDNGVDVAGEAAATAVAVQAADDEEMSNSDDDEEMDLFGDLTPEEQAAADEKKRVSLGFYILQNWAPACVPSCPMQL